VTPAATLAAEFAKWHGKRVAELMSENVITATEDMTLAEIAAVLERNRIKRVPIVRDGDLVGIVSRSNLVQAMASNRGAPNASLDASRTIRAELLSRLEKE
jgi:CBS domain-containing protein